MNEIWFMVKTQTGDIRMTYEYIRALGRWEGWEDGETAKLERMEGSEVASWERWGEAGIEEVARWERWESGEVARWEVPGFIQEWVTKSES